MICPLMMYAEAELIAYYFELTVVRGKAKAVVVWWMCYPGFLGCEGEG